MEKQSETSYSFTSPPQWLTARSDYSPWLSNGRQKAWHCVEGIYHNSAPDVRDEPNLDQLSEEDILARKLFSCWLYHWKAAGAEIDGQKVIGALVSGRGFVRGGNLGGNPLFDLVLADGLCDQQHRAAERFTADYNHFLQSVAFRVDPRNRVGSELPDWWGAFYMYLTGIASENAKPALESFRGYSGLKNWLRIALGLFLRRFAKKEGPSGVPGGGEEDRPPIPEPPAPPDDKPTPEEWATLSEHLVLAFKQARSVLSDEEWLRLYYHFGEKLQNQQVARIFCEDASKTTRRREAALSKFRNELMRTIAADPILRDLGNEVFTTWGREVGNLMQEFFKAGSGNRA